MIGSWLNGAVAGADDLRALALSNYGHFTAMPVRGGAVQALDFHIERLQSGTRELFGGELPRERILTELRRAVAQLSGDASLRFTVFARGFDYRKPLQAVELDVLITMSPWSTAIKPPLRTKTYCFVRPLPQVKHVGTFPLFHYRRQAQLAGFDDALFVDSTDYVVEGSVWNLGFWDGESVFWPQGPALRGSSEALLQAGLRELGVNQHSTPVALAEVGRFTSAFACNANGLQPISQIDSIEFEVDSGLMAALANTLMNRPWQRL